MAHLTIKDLSAEERMLWNRVIELWNCSVDGDFHTIDEAIHPRYVGWDNKSLLPHDRKFALQSVTDNSVLLEFKLLPLGITVYEHKVGITNYRYRAKIRDIQKNLRAIKGRWTEIYIRKNESWTLIGVHGGPEPMKVVSATNLYQFPEQKKI